MKEDRTDQPDVLDLTQRVVEQNELVDGPDAVRYNAACDYPETSDYAIFAERLSINVGVAGKRVLEIGPGPGNLCGELLERGAALVVGVEPSLKMLAHAMSKYGQGTGNIRFDRESVYSLPEDFGGMFDLVVCQNSFHQLHNPPDALREMVRAAATGGFVYITDFRRDIPPAHFEERVSYTKPGIRQDLIDSIHAALTKQEFRELLGQIPGISFSVTDTGDPRGLSRTIDDAIARDPVPHFRDYLISQNVVVMKK